MPANEPQPVGGIQVNRPDGAFVTASRIQERFIIFNVRAIERIASMAMQGIVYRPLIGAGQLKVPIDIASPRGDAARVVRNFVSAVNGTKGYLWRTRNDRSGLEVGNGCSSSPAMSASGMKPC